MAISKIAADEDFDNPTLFAVLRAKPDLDVYRIQDTEYYGAKDQIVLEWLAREDRVLLTHDAKTMPNFAYERVARGESMPGVIEVDPYLPFSCVLNDLLEIAELAIEEDLIDQVIRLPY